MNRTKIISMAALASIALSGCNVNSAYDEWEDEQQQREDEANSAALRSEINGVYAGSLQYAGSEYTVLVLTGNGGVQMRMRSGNNIIINGNAMLGAEGSRVAIDGVEYHGGSGSIFKPVAGSSHMSLSKDDTGAIAGSYVGSMGEGSVFLHEAYNSRTIPDKAALDGKYTDSENQLSFTIKDGVLRGVGKGCEYYALLDTATKPTRNIYAVSALTETCGGNTNTGAGMATYSPIPADGMAAESIEIVVSGDGAAAYIEAKKVSDNVDSNGTNGGCDGDTNGTCPLANN